MMLTHVNMGTELSYRQPVFSEKKNYDQSLFSLGNSGAVLFNQHSVHLESNVSTAKTIQLLSRVINS